MKTLFTLIKHHLLISVTLTFILGIIAGTLIVWSLSILALLLLLLFIVVCGQHPKKQRLQLFCLCLFFFIVGCYLGNNIDTPPNNSKHIYYHIQKRTECILIGTLISIQSFPDKTTRVILVAEGFQQSQDNNITNVVGKTRLTLKAEWPNMISVGDRVAIRVFLQRPKTYKVPGVFNYSKYLSRQSIWLTGSIKSPLFIQKIFPQHTKTIRLQYVPELLRLQLGAAIDSFLPKTESSLYKALLIGDRTHINKEALEGFKNSGVMHILAISGLHLSLLSIFLFKSIYWLLRRSESLILRINSKKTAAIICITPLVGYTLLAGCNPPVLRSLLMALIIIFALCTNRLQSLYTTIALAAMMLLAANPATLFTASFQLTFAAVISITIISPVLKTLLKGPQLRFHQKIFKWVLIGFIVSLVATIGTAPFLLFYFNRFSLVGPIANLIIEPLICFWSLPLGFLGSALLPLSPYLAAMCFKIGALGLTFALKFTTFFGFLPFSHVWLPTPSPILICLYYGILFVILLGSSYRKLNYSALAPLCVCLFFFIVPPKELLKGFTQDSTLSFIDVGHGSSTLIESPGGKKVLIDGGGFSTPHFNVGENIIAPYIWKMGITKIDRVVITHPDSDHINGLSFILKHFNPKEIWTSTLTVHNNEYGQLLDLAKKLYIKTITPEDVEQYSDLSNTNLTVIPNPSRRGIFLRGKNETTLPIRSTNDTGLILKYTHNDFSALFPGDISSNIESRLLAENIPMKADIFLSSHHGSRFSNSNIFLKSVNPELMIVSNSASSKNKKSQKDLLRKCALLNIDMLTTSEHGTLIITSQGDGFTVNRAVP